MNPHSSDSYQPSDKGDHSNKCTLIGDGSVRSAWTRGSSAKEGRLEMKVRASGFRVDWRADEGICGVIADINVMIVCNGSSGTQDSI